MILELISNVDSRTRMFIAVTTLTVVYVIYRFQKDSRRHPHSPPSLPSVPFLGSLPFLPWSADQYHGFFLEKSKTLGKVFTFQAGSEVTVVLNGREAIYEALVKRSADFADRAPMFAERNVWNTHLKGIISKRYNTNFNKNHQLSLSILRELGFGNPKVLESRIMIEVEDFLKTLRESNAQSIYPKEAISLALLNIISGMLLAHRFEGVDDTLRGVIKGVAQFLDQLDPVLDILPSSRYLPKYRKLTAEMHQVKSQVMGVVQALVKVGLGKQNEENFVKSFVSREGDNYNEEDLEYIVRDLANGGMQTTGIMLQWAIILLGNNPYAQNRMRQELHKVVPRDRLPSLDDRRQLPYIEATILEIFRCRGLLPFVFPHATLCATEVSGFHIPEKSTVLLNMHSVHMDPDVWSNPEEFQPERFLNEDGSVVNKEKVIPFSLGKRSCPGEELAKQEMFLFLSSLVQNFNIFPPEGQSKIRDEAVVIRFQIPAVFQVRFLARN